MNRQQSRAARKGPERRNHQARYMKHDIPTTRVFFWRDVLIDIKCGSSSTIDMSKSLADLCIFCIANNLQNINNVGAFLCKNDHEVLLELLCDHDKFTAHNLPYITNQLLTSRLKNIAFRYSRQVNDNLLHCVAQSGCKLKSFTLLNCAKVTGEYRMQFFLFISLNSNCHSLQPCQKLSTFMTWNN